MKKTKRKASMMAILFLCICLLLAGYCLIGIYYISSFAPGTFANGIYCTGKSVEVINTELKEQQTTEYLTITGAGHKEYQIQLSDISYEQDFSTGLKTLQEEQKLLTWGEGLISGQNHTIVANHSFSEEALLSEMENCGLLKDNVKEPVVEIRRQHGYVLYDGMKNAFQPDEAFELIKAGLLSGNFTVDLSSCYADEPYTKEMQDTLKLWEKVDRFQNRGITYDMGDEMYPLTPVDTMLFIARDKEGEILLDERGYIAVDEAGVQVFIDKLCGRYDTLGKPHVFEATRGETVTIEGGIYGNKLDAKAEYAYLLAAFSGENQWQKAEVHVPAYEKEAYVRGYNDIGDTYVEVDMTAQKLYFYDEGECVFETDVVTGNTGRRMGTPVGVNYVYSRQRNRTLRGATYASFVRYWMPVNGNIGIHDASWRWEFGGEIYKTNGSHGCINVPKDRAGELYDLLFLGVPVVMFY